MILGFKKEFVGTILIDSKIHSIREDKLKRWKVGMKIHFATGVRTKKYKQFKLGRCKGIQEIYIDDSNSLVIIDNNRLNFHDIETVAFNDGFRSIEDFFKFFGNNFSGRIIHWTDLNY